MAQWLSARQGCKFLGRAGPLGPGRAGLSGPARPKQISGSNGPARPGPTEILGRNGPAQLKSRAGPGRSCLILFLSVFLKDFLKKIWTLLLTHFKLSIFISKTWRNIGEIFPESWQKTARLGPARRNSEPERPGPAKIQARPARPGPVHLNLRAGTARPGPICQVWDLQPCSL